MIEKLVPLFIAAVYCGMSISGSAAEAPDEWRKLSDRTRARMREMDEIIRDRDARRSYERYLEIFSPDVRAYGLFESGPVGPDGLRNHYHPVFFQFRDGVLLSDDVIVAGNMAAQRYHSMLYLDGEFDGVEARDRAVFLRGQTLFRFDSENLIAERWSNHDHAFRMQQLNGAEGEARGKELAATLNGPGLSEHEVLAKLADMTRTFNLVQAPTERYATYLSFFGRDAKVHGLKAGVADIEHLGEYLEETWRAFPDLERIDESYITAWSFGAVRWRALGSHRATFGDKAPTMRPIRLAGEAIIRFANNGQIAEIWLNNEPVASSGLYPSYPASGHSAGGHRAIVRTPYR